MEKVVQSLNAQAEAFLLNKKVAGCSENTLAIYRLWLRRFLSDIDQPTVLAANQFVAHWYAKGLKQSGLARGVRALGVFFKWCVAIGALQENRSATLDSA